MEVLQLGFIQLIDQDELFSFHWKCDAARIFQPGFADDLFFWVNVSLIKKRGKKYNNQVVTPPTDQGIRQSL